MIRLKKKQDDEKAAEAAAAMEIDEETPSNAAAQPKADEEKAAGKLHVLGIGGRRAKRGSAKATGTKKTPGEIRIQKDIADLDGGSVAEITFPNPNNLTSFKVKVQPDSGFWKGASYHFTFTIPALYPHDPPKVLCETKIYHPNINLQGNVCLNILREDWKPVLDINAVIYGLIYLFYEPNPEDPLNHEAAELYRDNISQFERTVKRTLAGCVMHGETFQRLI
ncbi:unnamed protein product [Ectocarpus sp. CCAP 1310/34]|nr:unnamed protein product [Ectocarpus sp. CCAP 1310/34]